MTKITCTKKKRIRTPITTVSIDQMRPLLYFSRNTRRVAYKCHVLSSRYGNVKYDTVNNSVLSLCRRIHNNDPRVHDDNHKTLVVMTSVL